MSKQCAQVGWLAANTFIFALLIGLILIHLWQQQNELETKVDHRFKSYDAEFIMDHCGCCIDATVEEVREYYQGRETPIAHELLQGRWLCNQP